MKQFVVYYDDGSETFGNQEFIRRAILNAHADGLGVSEIYALGVDGEPTTELYGCEWDVKIVLL